MNIGVKKITLAEINNFSKNNYSVFFISHLLVHMKIFDRDSIQSFDFTMFYKQITLVLARI